MVDKPIDTGRKADGTFAAGNRANPTGRPRGSQNRATKAAQALLDGEAEALTRAAVQLALGGDTTALRLCLERLIPPRKDATVEITLPAVTSASDITKLQNTLLEAVGAGVITPSQADDIGRLGEHCRKAIETQELEARIKTLENRMESKK